MSLRRARRSALVPGALALALSIPVGLEAQSSFEDAIEQFNSTNARGYVQPLADVLVANLSSGFFYSPAPRRGFGLSIEGVAMGTSISDKMRTFTATTPAGFQPPSFTAPTVFGGKATPVTHSTIPSLQYRTSDGVLDAEMFPTAIPQLRLSGIANTELVARYFDSDLLGGLYPDDLPKLTTFGVGLRHGISQYFADLPVDIAVSGSYNSMTFGDYAELTGTTFGANVGRSFGVLALMGGVESAGGSMNLTYTSKNAEQPGSVDIDLEAKRQLRFTAGAMLDLKAVRIFGTAGVGEVTTYSVGVGIGN